MQDAHETGAAQSHCHFQFGAPARAQLQFHVHEPASSSSLPTVWDVTWPNAPPFCPFTLPQSQSHDAGCVSSSASALTDSSRSQFHVHSQTWRPLAPGCWMPLPSTTTERFVSSPLVVVETATPVPADAVLC